MRSDRVGTFRIATTDGWIPVQARFYGPLAVHRPLDWNKEGPDVVTITHVATGMSAGEDIPRSEMLGIIRQLLELDWSFTTPRSIPKETNEAAKRILSGFVKVMSGVHARWDELQKEPRA